MSYIRCSSNPEGLYIWGNHKNEVEIVCDDHVPIQTMPIPTFHGILKRWWANEFGIGDRTVLRYQGAILEQTENFRWRLTYKNWDGGIVMWDATLVYLCAHNQHRWNKEATK